MAKPRNLSVEAKTVLTAAELEAARAIPVSVVWWEQPDRSWESLCLSAAEAERKYAQQEADHLNRTWGKTGRWDRQTLVEWLDGRLRAAAPASGDEFVTAAREVLRRAAAGEPSPVTVQTW